MDIKFTFKDGSESLAHYGVKGMKWGKHKAGLQAGTFEGGGGAMDLDEEKQKEVHSKPHDSREKTPGVGIAAQLEANVPDVLRGNSKLNAKKRVKDYFAERKSNAAEFKGDEKGLERANKRTDNFYGKNGRKAQAIEAQRRRRSSDRLEAAMKRDGYSRGSDGVWRKNRS